MAERILSLDELKEKKLEELLREVALHREPMTVRLEDGAIVVIQPAPSLRPLPELEGFVPAGWRDAVYAE